MLFLVEGELVRISPPNPTEFPNFSREERMGWNTNQPLTLISLLNLLKIGGEKNLKIQFVELGSFFDKIFSECKS